MRSKCVLDGIAQHHGPVVLLVTSTVDERQRRLRGALREDRRPSLERRRSLIAIRPIPPAFGGISGSGGIRGPDLGNIGDRATRAQIATRIYSGASNMPSYVKTLSPEQLDALLSFLESRARGVAPLVEP